jgi:hypothetical protein
MQDAFVDYEIQLLDREPIMLCKNAVDFADYVFGFS